MNMPRGYFRQKTAFNAKMALRLNETDEVKVLSEGIKYAESCDEYFEEDDFEDNIFEDDDFEFDTDEEYLI